MNDLKHLFYESLEQRIAALETALSQLASSSSESIRSIREVVRDVKDSGTSYGFPNLSETARILLEADEKTLVKYLPEFIELLKRILETSHSQYPRILIIDDDPLIARLLQSALSTTDYLLDIAETVNEADIFLISKHYSLIFLDIFLPEANGLDYLVEIKHNPNHAKIPVVILSGKKETDFGKRSLELGAIAFLEKPLDINQLTGIISGILEKDKPVAPMPKTLDLLDINDLTPAFDKLKNQPRRPDHALFLSIINIDTYTATRVQTSQKTCPRICSTFIALVRRHLGAGDVIARFQGGKLLIFFPDSTRDRVTGILDTVRKHFQSIQFSVSDDRKMRGKFSATVAEIHPEDSLKTAIGNVKTLFAEDVPAEKSVPVTPRVQKNRKNILMAEDDLLISTLVRHRLEKAGYKLSIFSDGKSALDAALADPSFALILLDIKMPIMDGFEVLHNLRNNSDYQQVPIIILTSMGNEKNVIRGLEQGATDYILKPFSPVELVARINRLLKTSVPAA